MLLNQRVQCTEQFTALNFTLYPLLNVGRIFDGRTEFIDHKMESTWATVWVVVTAILEMAFGDCRVVVSIMVYPGLHQIGQMVVGARYLVVLCDGLLFKEMVLQLTCRLNGLHRVNKHWNGYCTASWMALNECSQGFQSMLSIHHDGMDTLVVPVEQEMVVGCTLQQDNGGVQCDFVCRTDLRLEHGDHLRDAGVVNVTLFDKRGDLNNGRQWTGFAIGGFGE